MRVALVAGPDPGHLVPIAGLAGRLRARGHDTLVVTGSRWRSLLERDDLGYAELPLIAAEAADADAGHRLAVRPARMAAPLAAVLAGWRPELVVADTLTRAGALAAGLLSVPWIEFVPHMLTDPSRTLPPFGTGWAPNPLRDRVLRQLSARSVASGRRQREAVWAAAGLACDPPCRRLIATLPSLEPSRPDWPLDAAVVGPMRWEPADVDLRLPAGSGPLLVVVGSTASTGGADLLSLALGTLQGMRVASPRLHPARRAVPDWASAGSGRLGPLLTAASAVVAPGGHGVVAAALVAGLPLVLLPGPGDQKEVAGRVVRLGAGIVCRPKALQDSVVRVVTTPSYATAARAAGASAAGAADAVRAVEQAVGSGGRP